MVTDFGISRKHICDFLLGINTNLQPIFRRFQIIADYRSKFYTLVRGEPLNSRQGTRNIAGAKVLRYREPLKAKFHFASRSAD